MLTDRVRQWSRGIIDPIARFVSWTGISPNGITLIGFLLMVVVGLLLSQGRLQLAGALLIVAALFDAIDGALARIYNRVTRFGAFFDSTMDRYAEAVLFLGILVYLDRQGAGTEIILTYIALVGSLMVSYTRARGEGLGVSIRGGLLTRLERIVILVIFLLLNQLTLALWILAPLTNLTALQRIWLAWRATHENSLKQ
ncbi:MAG: CDP-alcohol phosphatidyltransferase family protein [Anaerolineae bacterium]